MDITTFLAQIWGPVIFAVALGTFVSRKYYMRLYHDLEKETLAVLVFGMTAMAVGIAQVSVHNMWGNLPQVIISILGWALLIKGAAFAVVPKWVDRGGDWAADSKLVPVIGGVMLIVSAYLSWIGYFA